MYMVEVHLCAGRVLLRGDARRRRIRILGWAIDTQLGKLLIKHLGGKILHLSGKVFAHVEERIVQAQHSLSQFPQQESIH